MPTWYKAGTVSVVQNSNTVIGTNTEFIANSRVGDAFLGPDGWWYEITNVASNTALSISPDYKGDSNAAGTYALVPINGYPKALADAFNGLNNRFGPTLALLGETPTLDGIRQALQLADTDGMPEGEDNLYYTADRVRAAVLTGLATDVSSAVVAADTLLAAIGKLQAQASTANTALGNKAASGANNDITSLAALTTALSVGQGGTGVKTIAALLAALQAAGAYGKSNIVGTVSDSGGVPNGAILQSGNIGGGYFEKYASGFLLIRQNVVFAGGTAANGGVFKSLTVDCGPLPIAFVGDFSLFGYGISQASGGGWAGQQTFGTNGTWGQWAAYTPVAVGGTINLSLLGVGRWK